MSEGNHTFFDSFRTILCFLVKPHEKMNDFMKRRLRKTPASLRASGSGLILRSFDDLHAGEFFPFFLFELIRDFADL